MTQTCKTCRWWAVNANGNPSNLPLNAAFACKCPSLDVAAHDAWDTNCAGVDDGYGVFVTGPDFGCVHYDARPLPIEPAKSTGR